MRAGTEGVGEGARCASEEGGGDVHADCVRRTEVEV